MAFPGGLGVGRCEAFEAPGGVGRDHVTTSDPHHRVGRLAAALTGAVTGGESIAPLHGGLNRAGFEIHKAITDSEAALLVVFRLLVGAELGELVCGCSALLCCVAGRATVGRVDLYVLEDALGGGTAGDLGALACELRVHNVPLQV